MSRMPRRINSAIYNFGTQNPYSVSVGYCSYLLEDIKEYKLSRMFENGISYDVDMSNMPFGINSAIYFLVTQGLCSVIVGTYSYLWRTTMRASTSTSGSACSERDFIGR